METRVKNMKDVPVSTFLGVVIIVVFSLYFTTAIKTLPCGKNVMTSFYSNFVHVEPSHLIVNIYALYALSRVEETIGAKKFMSLIIFALIFNTIVEAVIYKWKNIPCSIGFSGVLFTILTWDLVTTKKLDLYLSTSVISMVLVPSLLDEKVSFTGHAVGAVSGVIAGLLWNKIYITR